MNIGYPRRPIETDALSLRLRDVRFIVNAFGRQNRDPLAVCGTRVTGDIELIYYRDGTGIIPLENRRLRVGKGQVVVIPPYTKHAIEVDPHDLPDNFFLHIDVDPLYRRNEIVDLLTQSMTVFVHPVGDDPFLEAAYALLDGLLTAKPHGHYAAACGVVTAIVARLVADAPLGRPGSYPDRAACVAEFLSSHLHEPIAVPAIARGCGFSRRTLHAVTLLSYGTSPMRLLQLLRLRRAEQLLLTTDQSVKQISAQVGFASPYHFSAQFKTRYGVAPREFRAAGRR